VLVMGNKKIYYLERALSWMCIFDKNSLIGTFLIYELKNKNKNLQIVGEK